MSICALCGRKVGDGAHVCPKCTETIARDLGDVAALIGGTGTSETGQSLALADELEVTYTRRSIGARSGGGRKSKADMQDGLLLWDERASKAARNLRGTLVTWTRITLEERGTLTLAGPARRGEPWPIVIELAGPVADTLPSMAALLLRNLAWWCRRDDVKDFADDIAATVERARRVVDREPGRLFIGPCMADIIGSGGGCPGPDRCGCGCHNGYGNPCTFAGGCGLGSKPIRQCTEDLYAKIGETVVTCRACKAEHDVAKRRDFLLAASEDLLLHAAWIAQALSGFGVQVKVERIWQWASRGQLLAHGVDLRGRPTYRVGDVMDLLQADVERTERLATRRRSASA